MVAGLGPGRHAPANALRTTDHSSNPRPAASELGRIYPADYYSFSGTSHPLVARLQRIWESSKVKLYRRYIGEGRRRVLDVGCGWGGLSRWMTMQHGVEVTGITISREQADLARQRCQGLPVMIELMDYRDLSGQFDCIVSVGMFEHVGRQNYASYFKTMHSLLAPGGLFLLQTIGARRHVYSMDPWIEKYIFPNGMLPPARAIVDGTDKLFTIEDWHNFGADYDRTLMAWHQNLIDAWPSLSGQYDDRFRRMFEYYLLTCAGAFRSRENQCWQVVLSAGGISGGYRSIR